MPVPEEQRVIEKMQKLKAAGMSLRAIRDQLRTDGHAVSHVLVSNARRNAG
jgi:hypothetical protein